MDADVIVVGTGTVGAFAAAELARRGAHVIAVDRWAAGNDRGAAGGESRVFRTAYHEGAGYVPLLRESRALWEEFEARVGRQVLLATGALSIGPADGDWLTGTIESARTHGVDHEVLSADDLRRRFPQHRVDDADGGLLDTTGGLLRPELALALAGEEAVRLGVDVRPSVRVSSLEAVDDGVCVRCEGGVLHAPRVLLAAGAWSAELSPFVADVSDVHQICLTWFAPEDPQQFTPEAFPVFLRWWQGLRSFGGPSVDGASVKVSLTGSAGIVPGPDSVGAGVTDEALERIERIVAHTTRGLLPHPVRTGSWCDAYTRDDAGLLGADPSIPGVVLATGWSGQGFKFAPLLGQAAAAIVDGQALPAGMSMFDVARFAASTRP